MAQRFPPGITALAHKHRLGTPLKRDTQLGMLLFYSALIIIFVLVDVSYLLNLLAHPPTHLNLAQLVVTQVLLLGLVGFWIYALWKLRATSYYLCTEGFLELTRSNPPTVKHALRWDDVYSVRLSGRTSYRVTDKQGQEFRITSFAVGARCRKQAKGEQVKSKRSKKHT